MLNTDREYGKMLTVRDSFLVCPGCGKNKKLLKIYPDTVARRVRVFCRNCKREHIVDIEQGQCFESRSQ